MAFNPLVSICIPTYNCASYITRTIDNILAQKYSNIEIIISDDCSTDNTVKTIRKLKHTKIKIFQNKTNLGYAGNLHQFKDKIKGDIIYLLGQDDLIINDGLKKTIAAFANHQVGVVTRAYYWFTTNPSHPIRHIAPANPKSVELINLKKSPSLIVPLIESVGQLSGLAYRRNLFTQFGDLVFTAHIIPFFQICTTHLCAFLPDYTIAVSTNTSQTRFVSKIYDYSPTLSWMVMFKNIFFTTEFIRVKHLAINHMAKNYLGLFQIRNYSKYWHLLREIYYLIKYRPLNLLSPMFIITSLTTLLLPPAILIRLILVYKETILSRRLLKITSYESNS